MELTKKTMVAKIAEDESITKVAAEEMYEAVFGALVNALEEGNEVAVPGLGKFKIATRNARTARNPQDGSEVEIPEHSVVKFAPAKGLKEAVYSL